MTAHSRFVHIGSRDTGVGPDQLLGQGDLGEGDLGEVDLGEGDPGHGDRVSSVKSVGCGAAALS